jgi:hypothetical protein
MALKQSITPSRLLIQYNGLVKEFSENTEECTWTIHEVAEFHDRWLLMQSRIENHTKEIDSDPADLQIYQNTLEFCAYFERIIDNHAHKDGIIFDFDEDTIDDIKDSRLDSFDDSFEEVASFFDINSDEEEDDEEES